MSRGLSQEGGTGYGETVQEALVEDPDLEGAGGDCKVQEMRAKGKNLQARTRRDKKKEAQRVLSKKPVERKREL